jgi:hypothetical protein
MTIIVASAIVLTVMLVVWAEKVANFREYKRNLRIVERGARGAPYDYLTLWSARNFVRNFESGVIPSDMWERMMKTRLNIQKEVERESYQG